jgi:hypothetical protein
MKIKLYDYYLHRSGGRAFDYFGGIGTPFKVSMLRFYLWKWLGFRATRVVKNSSLRRVVIRATLHGGAHRHSIKMQEAKNYTP